MYKDGTCRKHRWKGLHIRLFSNEKTQGFWRGLIQWAGVITVSQTLSIRPWPTLRLCMFKNHNRFRLVKVASLKSQGWDPKRCVAGQEKKGKTNGITVSDRRNITLTRYCIFKRSIVSTYRQISFLTQEDFFVCFILCFLFFCFCNTFSECNSQACATTTMKHRSYTEISTAQLSGWKLCTFWKPFFFYSDDIFCIIWIFPISIPVFDACF